MDNAVLVAPCTNSTLAMRLQAIQDNYTPHVRRWFDWMDSTGYGIDEIGIQKYFQLLLTESHYSASTIRVRRQAAKKRIDQAFHDADDTTRTKIERLLKDLDRGHNTKAPSIQRAAIDRDKSIDENQFKQILALCRSKRQQLYFKFLYETGCRVAEMVGARLDKIELTETAAKVTVIGKGSKERTVRIHRATYEEIVKTCQGQVYLFETANHKPIHPVYVSSQVKRIGKRAGVKISAHCMRHSWATRMVKRHPASIDAISRYMGHSSVAITLNMYVHTNLTEATIPKHLAYNVLQ